MTDDSKHPPPSLLLGESEKGGRDGPEAGVDPGLLISRDGAAAENADGQTEQTLQSRQPPTLKILLWGARDVGKTMFLYGLATTPGFDADPEDDNAWEYSAAARERVVELADLPGSTLLVTESRWLWDPAATRDADGQIRAVEVSERSIIVSIVDIPGELTDVDELPAPAGNREAERDRVLKMVSQVAPHAQQAHAMIFLLDPTATAGGRRSLVGDLLRELRRNQAMTADRKAAIVLTKVDDDMFLRDHCKYLTRDPSSPAAVPYLTPEGARRLTADLRQQMPNSSFGRSAQMLNDALSGFHERGNLAYFGVSAAGFYLDGGRYVPGNASNVERSFGTQRLKSWPEPHTRRALDVLHWLLPGHLVADHSAIGELTR